jgi:hypothetical protein
VGSEGGGGLANKLKADEEEDIDDGDLTERYQMLFERKDDVELEFGTVQKLCERGKGEKRKAKILTRGASPPESQCRRKLE